MGTRKAPLTGEPLFADLPEPATGDEPLAEGAVLLRGFATPTAPEILDALDKIAAAAPFRHMTTPGGYRMSVAMTNCGGVGWVSDKRGYRYDSVDPITAAAWPAMPPPFLTLALSAACPPSFNSAERAATIVLADFTCTMETSPFGVALPASPITESCPSPPAIIRSPAHSASI
jgi:hypothetical protein